MSSITYICGPCISTFSEVATHWDKTIRKKKKKNWLYKKKVSEVPKILIELLLNFV